MFLSLDQQKKKLSIENHQLPNYIQFLDQNTSRCRLNFDFIQKNLNLNLKFGQPILITINDQKKQEENKNSKEEHFIHYICETSPWGNEAQIDPYIIRFDPFILFKTKNENYNQRISPIIEEIQNILPAQKIIIDILDSPTIPIQHSIKTTLLRRTLKTGCKILIENMKIKVKETFPKNYVQVNSATLFEFSILNIKKKEKEKKKRKEKEKENLKIGGYQEILKELKEIILIPQKNSEIFEYLNIEPNWTLLIKGPNGTGKTLLCKYVVNECKGIIFEPKNISTKSILDNFEKAKNAANSGIPSFLLFENLESFCPKKEEEEDYFSFSENEKNQTNLLITLIDKKIKNLFFLATSKSASKIDKKLLNSSRFSKEIFLNIPSIFEREEIFKIHLENIFLKNNLKEKEKKEKDDKEKKEKDDTEKKEEKDKKFIDFQELAEITPGFTGADIYGVCQQALFFALQKSKQNEEIEISIEDFKKAISKTTPSSILNYSFQSSQKNKKKFLEIGGLEKVKEILKKSIEWPLKFPRNFQKFNLTPPKGILLYGPPGTAKTSLIKSLIYSLKLNFFSLNGSNLFSCFLGESEEFLREIFKKAKMAAPSIIFIDEIDGIVRKRGMSEGNNVEDRVLTTLLNEMDGIEKTKDIILIACTNRIDLLDDALLRPGRIDIKIFVGLPDFETREKIFEIYTSNMPISKKLNLKNLAEKTEGYSGAEIENICREAALFCLRNHFENNENELVVDKEHFEPFLKKKIIKFDFNLNQ